MTIKRILSDLTEPLYRSVRGETRGKPRPFLSVIMLTCHKLTMPIEEVLMAPRSPWQNPYVERLIGSIRRECLDHVIVLHERHLWRLLTDYVHYDHRWRTYRALDLDCPRPRPIQRPESGPIWEVPEVDGWHHHDERHAA